MERDSRFDGPLILVLWSATVVGVVILFYAALDAVRLVGAAPSAVLTRVMGHNVVFGAFAALTFIGAASHLSPQYAWEHPKSEVRPGVLTSALGSALAVALAAATAGASGWGTLGFALAVGLALLVLAITTGAAVFALRRLPAPSAWFAIRVFVAGLALGSAGAFLFDHLVSILQRGSLMAVAAIVPWVFEHPTSELTQNRVGTAAFQVRVFPSCSGVEGMTLGALLVVPYLYLMRRQLRFPRALLLIPSLLCALALVNVGRIVAFIAVGQHASRTALNAFHSSIGWFTFAATIAAVIPATEAVFRLRIPGAVGIGKSSAPNEAAPYLVPFALSLLAAFALSALANNAIFFAYGRYAAAALALLWYRKRMVHAGGNPWPAPFLAGATVAALYILAPPIDETPSRLVAAAYRGLDPLRALPHVLGYVIVTPLIEELAFRGYLLRRLVSESFSEVSYAEVGWGPILVSSLAFSAVHGLFLHSAIAGIVFAMIAQRGGGLRGAVIAHAVANGLLVLYAVVFQRLGLIT
jgi:exosortase E/protease (VPEID-CTERM system)